MPVDPSVAEGARQIVQNCLGLTPNQQLVIFVDESTIEAGVALAEAADSLGIAQTVFLVPVSVQRRIPAKVDLSWLIQKAAREARAILTCVNASPDCLPFRQRIMVQPSAGAPLGVRPWAVTAKVSGWSKCSTAGMRKSAWRRTSEFNRQRMP